MKHLHPIRRLFLLAAFLTLVLGVGCDDSKTTVSVPAPSTAPPVVKEDARTIALSFPYGSEKKAWIEQVTKDFNAKNVKTKSGKTVAVNPVAMGSGEQMTEILAGRLQADLVSPASGLFVTLANAESRGAGKGDLVGDTQSLVLSPVVIAMWRPMAEALGWPEKPVGWRTVLDVVKNDKGWDAYGHPEWGEFKFGHTHPEYSNSGLISLCAEVYAGAGKTKDLTLEDVNDPKVGEFLSDIEKGVVHYGSSTGFFGRKMFERGPQFLSAAVMYENMVVESYGGVGGVTDASYNLPFPVVAIYPSEGTFWSDHPVGVVNREWVTPERAEAAKLYVDYLLQPEQQRAALSFGFRPGDPSVPLASPVDAAHGADPAEPRTTLAVPPAQVVTNVIELWKKNKKHANIALVLDTSGSMKEDDRIANAKAGAAELVKLLSDYDTLSLTSFNTRPTTVVPPTPLADGRSRIDKGLNGLFADGGTALYDAIAAAQVDLASRAGDDVISAVVVLSDGEDRNSRLKLPQLLDQIRSGGERKTVRVFTIGYGKDAKTDVLEEISQSSDAKSYKGTNDNIREIFKDIATFF